MKISTLRLKTIGVALGVCATFLGAAGPASPPGSPPAESRDSPPDVAGERASARAELMQGLVELAEWCTKKRVFACRAEVYGILLQFEPDNEVALRGLGNQKQRDGSWKPAKKKRAPKNYNKSAAREFASRRDALSASYKDRMLVLLEPRKPALSPSDRRAVIADVLLADPDDERVHGLLGEVKLGERWVLSQSARAAEHRKELKQMVKKAFGTLPEATPSEPNAREAGFGLAWKGVYESPIARSLSTVSKQEAERLTQAMWATRSYFNDALSAAGKLPEQLTVYTLAGETDRDLFLQNHPGIDDAYRETLRSYDGSGIAGTDDFAHWAPEPDRRLDGLVRHAITWLFASSYQIFPRHGWIFEGFGLYMTRELVGTRLTWYVRPGGEPGDEASIAELLLRKNLLDTRSNWMNEASKVLQKENHPKLVFLLGKDVNQLSMDDLLYSYVLAAYMIEAEGPRLPAILTKIGKGISSSEALESELGIDLTTLDLRVRRWLNERR